ncbi:carbohydrate ABC transporter permease [Acidaminobacter sp. JC074]|uniref:carbohydrate ABC transporter permease n=1 Tax=Acidaminobacter sp. JC074 TaxID=2530199 RepID=UPI001F0D22E9|nr:carbohydrate ABC transporter permease [Acidaminobacter sp. JC074]
MMNKKNQELDERQLKNLKEKRQRRVKNVIVYSLVYTFLAVLVVVAIIPFWIVIINATRDGMAISTQGITLFPGTSLKANYDILVDNVDIVGGFLNSLKIATLVTVLSGYFSALTAYGFYMYEFKGKNFLFGLILVFMMIPSQLAFLGYVKWMTQLGLMDTHAALIIPSIASIGTVFFLRAYISSSLSKQVIESARIDGAGEFHIFHKIALPLMAPGVATMSIFTFIGSWNNYLSARVILSSKENETLPMVISSLKALKIWHQNQGAVYLGFAVSIVPIVVVFIFASKYLIENISAGAVKG